MSSAERAPPLDLRTVPTRASLAGSPIVCMPRKRMFDLPEAPTYRPTMEEFQDPMRYIARIRPEAEQYGICKIIPPEGWSPTFVLDTETFRFRTRLQELNRMEGSTRANINYLQQLYRYHHQQGTPVRHIPQLNKRPVDLYRLRKEVQLRGGFEKVCREKQWAAIGRVLKVDGKTCTSLSNSLKTFYCKIIAPYEQYLAENAEKAKQISSSGSSTTYDLDYEREDKGSDASMMMRQHYASSSRNLGLAVKSGVLEDTAWADRMDVLATVAVEAKARAETPPQTIKKEEDRSAAMSLANIVDPVSTPAQQDEKYGWDMHVDMAQSPMKRPVQMVYGREDPMAGSSGDDGALKHTTPDQPTSPVDSQQHTPESDHIGVRRSKRVRKSRIITTPPSTSLPSPTTPTDQGSVKSASSSRRRVSTAPSTPSSSNRKRTANVSQKKRSPPKQQSCFVCQQKVTTDQLLSCADCDRVAHPLCVRSRSSGMDAASTQSQQRSSTTHTPEWYCPECVRQSDCGYGFEEGKDYSLHEFQKHADQFKEKWFSGRWTAKQAVNGTNILTETDVEKEYWRLVNSPFEHVEVEYGADLHTSQHGSGFSRPDRQPDDPYVNDPWNLNQLSTRAPSLFRYIRQGISGMMVPWLYVGMCFSTFCWHNEDHYTYSVNYLHWGEAKTWYAIPGADALKFEEAMRRVIPELFEQQPDLLFHLVTLLSPSQLTEQGVRVYTLDQHAGEFVITFPQSYHSGFNQGFNLAEAVNFATPDWCEYGVDCVMRYKQYRKPPVFSHDELMLTVAREDQSRETAAWLQCALAEIRDRELRDRRRVREYILGIQQVIDSRDRPEEEKQCCYCYAYAYISWIRCSCSSRVACLDHIRELCSCDLSTRILCMLMSDADLSRLVNHITAIAHGTDILEPAETKMPPMPTPSTSASVPGSAEPTSTQPSLTQRPAISV